MQKKIIVIFISFLFLTSVFSIISTGKSKLDIETNNSWLREIDGVKILYLNGSNYEMGYQHGQLLKDEVLQNFRAYKDFAIQLGFNYDDFYDLWDQVRFYVPQQYIDEMQGVADAVNLTFEEIAIVNIMTMWAHCSGFAAWDSATEDGSLYHARSFDFPLSIQDPETERYIQDNSVLLIREPDKGYISIDPSFAGLVGSLGGFNEKGISTEVLTCWSDDETIGTPMIFRQRIILDKASSAEQALNIIDKNRTRGWNFIISDAYKKIGYAVEQTAHFSYQGTWNHPVESNRPFWEIENVVRRTNIFIDRGTASTQRTIYNPRILQNIGFLLRLTTLSWGGTPAFIPWTHYKSLSKEIEKKWGEINLNNSMELLRELYTGKTNIAFRILQKIGVYTSLHQWVANPKTGDIVVSFAKEENNAFEQPVHYFNLYNLL